MMLNPSERNLILFPTFLLWLSFISMKFRVTAAPLTGLDSFNTSGSTLGDNPIYRRGSCFSKLCNGEEGYPTLEDIQHALKPGMPLRDKAIFYIQSQEESPLGRNTYAGQHNLVDPFHKSIWDPPNFADRYGYKNVQPWDEGDFLDHIYELFASRARGRVYMMLKPGEPIPRGGRFWRKALPLMMNGGKVTEIVWLNVNRASDVKDPLPAPMQAKGIWWNIGDPVPPNVVTDHEAFTPGGTPKSGAPRSGRPSQEDFLQTVPESPGLEAKEQPQIEDIRESIWFRMGSIKEFEIDDPSGEISRLKPSTTPANPTPANPTSS